LSLFYELIKNTFKFNVRNSLIKSIGLAFQAISLFLVYVNLINDLNVMTYVTISRVSWYRVLHIPLPLDRELLIVSTVIGILTEKMKLTSIILLILVMLCYLVRVPLLLPILSALAILWNSNKEKLKRLMDTVLIIVTSICVLATVRHIMYFVIGDIPFSHPSWFIAEVHLMLLTSFQLFSIITYTTLPVLPLIDRVSSKIFHSKIYNLFLNNANNVKYTSDRLMFTLLFISITLSLSYNILPYLPTVNSEGIPIGVDIVLYKTRLDKMIKGYFNEILYKSSYELLYMLVLYSLWRITGLPSDVIVRTIPVFLLPLLALTVYYLALKISRNKFIAVLSAFFTVAGPQGTVGTYGSFQANITALILAYIILAIHFSSSRRSLTELIGIVLCSMIAELLHPWTILHALIFAVIMSIYNKLRNKDYHLLLLAMVFGIFLGDLVRGLIVQSIRGMSIDVTRMHAELLFESLQSNLVNYPKAIYEITSLYYAGFMNYPPITLILLTPIVKDDNVKRFMLSWYLTLTLMYFTTGKFASRILYNVPLAIGVAHMTMRLTKMSRMLFVALLVVSISYSTLSLVNLVLKV